MKPPLSIIALVLLSLCAPTAQAGIQDVLDAMKAGDIKGAIRSMLSLSLLDDADQQMSAVSRGAEELGIRLDPRITNQVAELAASARDAREMQHQQAEKDRALFMQIRKRAAEGDIEALKAVSVMYARGWGVGRSMATSYALQGYIARQETAWVERALANQGALAQGMTPDEVYAAKQMLNGLATREDISRLLMSQQAP